MQCKYAVVGGSCAYLLANAIKATGVEVAAAAAKNWRVTAIGVKAMAKKVGEMLGQVSPETVIFYCLDETLFCGVREEGVVFPKVDTTGRLHLQGAAKVLSKESQYEVFLELLPLLMSVGTRTIILVMPFKRWVTAKCCNSAEHLTNFEAAEWSQTLAGKLEEATKNFKSFLFTKNIRNSMVVNPDLAVKDLPRLSVWGEDPVTPSEPYFKKLAAYIMAKGEKTSKKRPQDASEASSSNNKKPRQHQPQLNTADQHLHHSGSSSRGGHGGQWLQRGGRGRGYHHRGYYNSGGHF